jgi:hypothetical protein
VSARFINKAKSSGMICTFTLEYGSGGATEENPEARTWSYVKIKGDALSYCPEGSFPLDKQAPWSFVLEDRTATLPHFAGRISGIVNTVEKAFGNVEKAHYQLAETEVDPDRAGDRDEVRLVNSESGVQIFTYSRAAYYHCLQMGLAKQRQ